MARRNVWIVVETTPGKEPWIGPVYTSENEAHAEAMNRLPEGREWDVMEGNYYLLRYEDDIEMEVYVYDSYIEK